jgi:pimeloyl-ACP methyl ester carboxylesterase
VALLLSLSAASLRAGEARPVFVLHLPGIAGERSLDRNFARGLVQGGLADRVEIYDWTGSAPGLVALSDVKRNRAQAEHVAGMIVERRRTHPDERFILVGHSGGTGIGAWALEQLPEGVSIDTFVLLAPALSPGYDLSRALARVNGRAYAFTSPHDSAVLGAGTRLFGTIDRVYVAAAGNVGFDVPESADAVQYGKLVEMPYRTEWMKQGNIGDHIGVMMRPFARDVLAPLLRSGELPTTRPTTAPGQTPAVPLEGATR